MDARMNMVLNIYWVYVWKYVAVNLKKNTFKIVSFWIVCSHQNLSPGAAQWLVALQLINGSKAFYKIHVW